MSSADETEIAALLHGYAFRLDAGDLDGVAGMFEHASLGTFGQTERVQGREGARSLYEPVILYEDGTPRTMHTITNVTISIAADAATATSRSYFTVFQRAPGATYEPIVGGAYHDRFARVDGRWRFAERCFELKLVGDLSRHMRTEIQRSDDA